MFARLRLQVTELRQANRLFSDALYGREYLVIPGVPGLPKFTEELSEEAKAERERQRKVKRFQVATKCMEPGEVTYYLELHNYDIEAAVKQYKEDVVWEQAHPMPKSGPASAAAKGRRAPVPAASRPAMPSSGSGSRSRWNDPFSVFMPFTRTAASSTG